MNNDRKYWLDEPRNVDRIFYALCALCALLGLADLFYHKHVHYRWESWFAFYGVYGFVCCVALVLTAKQMRKIVMRDERYYDR
jgi:hypothetical protein